jgi:hypothetical protein
MVAYLRPFFFSFVRIFVHCQRLIARNVADGFLLFSLGHILTKPFRVTKISSYATVEPGA